MSGFSAFLRDTIKSSRVAVLGVGSELCRDDGAGLYAVREIKKQPGSERLLLLCGESAPENFTGVIKSFKPDVLFIIDAAYMDLPAGSVQLLPYERAAGLSFSTHMLPLPIMLNYLEAEVGCETLFIGVQPRSTEQGLGMSAEVKAGVRRLAECSGDAFRALGNGA